MTKTGDQFVVSALPGLFYGAFGQLDVIFVVGQSKLVAASRLSWHPVSHFYRVGRSNQYTDFNLGL